MKVGLIVALIAVNDRGSKPRPGAISIATHGILFLDELPEFDRRTLEMLREPLESGEVRIARAAYQATYPANFMLIAAMNPSPSGYFADDPKCRSCQLQYYLIITKLNNNLQDYLIIKLWFSFLLLVGDENAK